MTTTTAIRGGAWLTEEIDAASVLTPERLSEEHRLIGRTAEEFVDNEVLPVLDKLEAKDWGAGARADPAMRRARAARHRRARGARRRRARQGGVAARRRGRRPLRVVRDDVRRPDRPGGHSAALLRLGGAEGQVPAWPRVRRNDRRVCAVGVGLGLGRAQRQGPRRAAGRRQLPAVRREDVDHERRLRRSVRRVRQGRSTRRRPRVRAVHRVPRRARLPRRQHRQGRTQDGPARVVDDPADPAGRPRAGGERARRDRQGPQGRVQRPELRPLQAGGDVQRRRAAGDRAGGGVRRAAEAVRPAHRLVRRGPPQARRDDRPASTPSKPCSIAPRA